MQFRQEIETLRGTEAAERRRVEQDEKRLEELEDKLKRLESQSQKLGKTANTLEIDDTKFRNATDQRLQELPTQVAAKTSQPDFQSELSRYLGTHQFRLTGAAGEPSFTADRAEHLFAGVRAAVSVIGLTTGFCSRARSRRHSYAPHETSGMRGEVVVQ